MNDYRIGLIGPANAGKNTVAEMLTELLEGARLVSFADALYQEVAESYDVSTDYLRGREYKEVPSTRFALRFSDDMNFQQVGLARGFSLDEPLSPRQVLELWGTEYRRKADPDYWLKKVLEQRGLLVIPDVRYENEASICHTIWKILRPGRHILRDHASDQYWRTRNDVLEIYNVGSLLDLRGAVMGAIDGEIHHLVVV